MLNRAALICAFAAMLTGCGSLRAPQDDSGAIRVRWHKTPADTVALKCVALQTQRAAAWLERTRINVAGCYQIKGEVCHVYADADDTRALGHEVKHCFDGPWHGDRLDGS